MFRLPDRVKAQGLGQISKRQFVLEAIEVGHSARGVHENRRKPLVRGFSPLHRR